VSLAGYRGSGHSMEAPRERACKGVRGTKSPGEKDEA
jgi:hypothetical protein